MISAVMIDINIYKNKMLILFILSSAQAIYLLHTKNVSISPGSFHLIELNLQAPESG
jgi:hypothetical protein